MATKIQQLKEIVGRFFVGQKTAGMQSEDINAKKIKVENTVEVETNEERHGLKLPAEIQIAIRDGYITMGHARAIINIEDKTQQLIILKKIIDENLNVRQVETLVRGLGKNSKKEEKKHENVVPEAFKTKD